MLSGILNKKLYIWCKRSLWHKAFYYSLFNDNFIFSSETKAILEFPGFKKEVNEEALEQYLSFQYSVLPETFL